MAVNEEIQKPDLMSDTVTLVTKWNFNETQLDNGMTAYTKPIFGKNGNVTALIFLFPFGDPSFHSIMMEIVAYLPVVVPEKALPLHPDGQPYCRCDGPEDYGPHHRCHRHRPAEQVAGDFS